LDEALAVIKVMFTHKDNYIKDLQQKLNKIEKENQNYLKQIKEQDEKIKKLEIDLMNTSSDNSNVNNLYKKQSNFQNYNENFDKKRKTTNRNDTHNENTIQKENNINNVNNTNNTTNNDIDMFLNNYNKNFSIQKVNIIIFINIINLF
jgi:hypothetical protein